MSSSKDDFKNRAKRKSSSKDLLIPPLEEENTNEIINPSTNDKVSDSRNQNTITNANVATNQSINTNTNVINHQNSNDNIIQNTNVVSIGNNNENVNASTNQNASINNSDPLGKISKYLPQSEEEEERFENKYEQQNIYMERKIVKAINEILDQKKKKGKKLTKKDIYNNALKMYLEVAYNKTME